MRSCYLELTGVPVREHKSHHQFVKESMTYYKYTHFLMPEKGAEYDTTHKPGVPAPFAGIYYCEACGGSITSIRAQLLPSQEHHPHAPSQGPIRWRLAVKSHYG